MRWTLVVMLFVAGGSLAGGSLATAQTKKIQAQIEKELEKAKKAASEPAVAQLLQQALKENPDIRLAEAKLGEAEAHLNKIRMEILHKVLEAHERIKAGQFILNEAEARLKIDEELFRSKVISHQDMTRSQLTAQKAKAELELAKLALPALLGNTPASIRAHVTASSVKLVKTEDEHVRRIFLDIAGRLPTKEEMEAGRSLGYAALVDLIVRSAWSDNTGRERPIFKYLQTPIKADFSDLTPAEILKEIPGLASGVNLHVSFDFPKEPSGLKFKDAVPLAGLFQWFEDKYRVTFIMRDYGIIVMDPRDMPPYAVPVLQLWKLRDGGKK